MMYSDDLLFMDRLRPTPVFDTYWRFAAERQNVFFSRFAGRPRPWTFDSVLLDYKFTNAYRASDRVSQYLIRNVIYKGRQSPKEVVFRVLLFKIFNKIETWKLLVDNFGMPDVGSFDVDKYGKVLSEAMDRKERIYSAAYIMPTGKGKYKFSRKHHMHLNLIQRMIDDGLHVKIASADSLENVFDFLKSYPSIGSFLAYQYAVDINYSEVTCFSENDFVVAGPGAESGIRKCFNNYKYASFTEIIQVVTRLQDYYFDRLELKFKDLWGRKLHLIDCQNLFCETDKYSRVVHPEYEINGKRKRIKQKFKVNLKKIDFWYPPKWGLNEKMDS